MSFLPRAATLLALALLPPAIGRAESAVQPLSPPDAAATALAILVAGDRVIPLTPEVMASLPPATASASFLSSKGFVAAQYEGVLLWDLLRAEGVVGDDIKEALRHSVLVSARDGHTVAFSIGELAPDFGNRPVMLATGVDGQPSPGGLRTVAPGDGRGARYVHDVASIEVR